MTFPWGDSDGVGLYQLLDRVQSKKWNSNNDQWVNTQQMHGTGTFVEYAWFHTHGCEVQVVAPNSSLMKDTIVIANAMEQDCSDPATKKSKVQ